MLAYDVLRTRSTAWRDRQSMSSDQVRGRVAFHAVRWSCHVNKDEPSWDPKLGPATPLTKRCHIRWFGNAFHDGRTSRNLIPRIRMSSQHYIYVSDNGEALSFATPLSQHPSSPREQVGVSQIVSHQGRYSNRAPWPMLQRSAGGAGDKHLAEPVIQCVFLSDRQWHSVELLLSATAGSVPAALSRNVMTYVIP